MTIFLKKNYTDCMYKLDFLKKQGEYCGWVLRKIHGVLRVSRIIFIGEYSVKITDYSLSKVSKFKVSTPAFLRCTQGEYSAYIYKYIWVLLNTPIYLYIFSTACAHKIHQTKFTMQNF